jgi:hypothetical protein
MFRLDAVLDMPFGQCARGRQNAGQIGQAANHEGEACHELASLLRHVAGKERLHRRSDLEQPAIESLRRLGRHRRDLCKGLLHERRLLWSHHVPRLA